MARRPTAQERQISALLQQFQPQVRKAFIDAMRTAATAVDRAALIRALEARDISLAMEILRLNQQALFPMGEAVRAAYLQGGASVAASLPVAIRGQFGFGGNPRAVDAVQRIVGQAIEGVTAESLEATRGYITQAVADGAPPRRMALEITGRSGRSGAPRTGGIMGLNSNQTEAVIRARAELLSGDFAAYKRREGRVGGRNRSLDRLITRAQKEGRALTVAEVDTMVEAYKSRLLNLRGEMIARTETLNALRAGQHDGFATLIDSGAVTADRLTVTWQATADARTRDAHAALGGTTVRFGELFQSPAGGLLAHPGDTSHGAGPADLVACRCSARYTILPRARQ
ncbi:hypothetical protein K7H20_13775 [Salipiger manganoxidans]|uniref:phage minor head protein n=1 Tax=Salipiger marinus TaxID=555512 RepID=UPI001E58AD33|nr:phage minor head protein [Salipiger manganoxidans]MCD1619134.1 hypothetical protein [Salipiger manganoxidans]